MRKTVRKGGLQINCQLDLPIGEDLGGAAAPAGGSGPRLLHGDFDKVVSAVAPQVPD
jgi:hypothetical protein